MDRIAKLWTKLQEGVDNLTAREAENLTRWLVEEGDCLVWTGCLSHGSPHCGLRMRGTTPGRIVARAVYGDFPRHIRLTRTCGNNLCVEPSHLVVRDDTFYRRKHRKKVS